MAIFLYDRMKSQQVRQTARTYTKNRSWVPPVGFRYSINIDRRSAVTAAYTRTNNKGRKNYGTVFDQPEVYIQDFNLRHTNDFFEIGYERSFSVSNPLFRYHAGLMLVNSQQQEISIQS